MKPLPLRLLASTLLLGSLLDGVNAQNQALALTTGVDGGVSYAFDSRMVPATGITVEAWITYDDSTIPSGAGNYWPTIARQNTNPNQESWNLRVSASSSANRSLQFIIRTTGNALYSASYTFAAGEFSTWTHVAGTFDGQAIRLFKDGVQVATFTIPGTSEVVDNGGELRIGNGDPVAPGNETWNGGIDEVRIWPMARTEAEIAAAKDQEIAGLPASVLAFPFNGSYDSADGSLIGTPFGTSNFIGGPTTLAPVSPVLVQIGQPSSTCPRQAELLVGSAPLIGNSAFALWCVRGPTPTESPAAALFAATNSAAGMPSVLGVTLAIDPTTIVASAVQAPPTNVLGNTSFSLPIPNQASLSGAGWVFQYFFLDAPCGAQGFSASNGLLFAIQ